MPLYTVVNNDTESVGHGRVYVGSCTISLRRRMARHYYLGEHATASSPEMYRDMNATLKRVRADSETTKTKTTAILKQYYPIICASPRQSMGKEELRISEQELLEKMQGLTVGQPCYNIRRPIAKAMAALTPEGAEEKRALRKSVYHANKTMCSCGRMIAKGNRSHVKSSVHQRASKTM